MFKIGFLAHIMTAIVNKVNRIYDFIKVKNIDYILQKNNVEYNHGKCKIDPNTIIQIGGGGKIRIGDNFICRSAPYTIGNTTCAKINVIGGTLIIGHSTGFSNIVLHCYNKIHIGNYVNIGDNCIIIDTDFHSMNWLDREDRAIDFQKSVSKPINIKDYVFIGTRSIILKGVTIGARSIIAAGSVVVKDIPDDCIAGGNPCKVIKYIK